MKLVTKFMNSFSTKEHVVRKSFSKKVFELGYSPYVEDIDIQYLVKDTYFKGIRIHREILDKEVIPQHVMISVGAFGDTGGWKSKFADVINNQNMANA